jgi:hypothetical protein
MTHLKQNTFFSKSNYKYIYKAIGKWNILDYDMQVSRSLHSIFNLRDSVKKYKIIYKEYILFNIIVFSLLL